MRPQRNLTNQVGRTLTELREQAGFTQKHLALMADIDHSYISRIELGKRDPSRDVLEMIADAMGLAPYDRRRLLHAGGYLVAEAQDQERIDTIATLLTDPRVPAAYASAVRAQLDAMTNQIRIVVARPARPVPAPLPILGETHALPVDGFSAPRLGDGDRRSDGAGALVGTLSTY